MHAHLGSIHILQYYILLLLMFMLQWSCPIVARIHPASSGSSHIPGSAHVDSDPVHYYQLCHYSVAEADSLASCVDMLFAVE